MPEFSIFRQSGVIPFRISKNGLQVLMITSSSGQRWVFPKGIIEPDLTPQESAAAEALEEAGAEGDVLPLSLGTYMRKKWGGTAKVELFPMSVTKVLDNWPEKYLRRREWLSIEDARSRISDIAVIEMLRLLEKYIRSQA